MGGPGARPRRDIRTVVLTGSFPGGVDAVGGKMASGAAERGWALLEERPHAFLLVGAPEESEE